MGGRFPGPDVIPGPALPLLTRRQIKGLNLNPQRRRAGAKRNLASGRAPNLAHAPAHIQAPVAKFRLEDCSSRWLQRKRSMKWRGGCEPAKLVISARTKSATSTELNAF